MDFGGRYLALIDRRRKTLLLVSLFLILVGSRAAVINHGGNSTPFMDEWDCDAADLLRPYLQGSLTVGDLFRPLNEHIILFTRLVILAIFNLSGYWDVVLQMIANALLDAVTVVAISYALARVLRSGWALVAIMLSTLMNSLPLSYDNMLMGLNTHFYLLLMFSFASLWFLSDSPAWSGRWAAGVLCALGSFLCMASGALTLAAASGLHVLQMACGRRAGLREGLGIATLAAATFAMASLVLHAAASDPFRAHSARQFLSAFFELASWPAPPNLGVLVGLPSAVFCLRAFADRPMLNDPRWFNVAAFGWILTQFLAFAAGRAAAPVETRYFDTLLIGLSINMISLFWLLGSEPIGGKRRVWHSLALAAWLAIVAGSLAYPAHPLPGSLEFRRQTAAVEEKNVRDYLATGDASHLSGAPILEIPYDTSGRLRELLDAPEIRSALPPELLSKDKPRNWVETFKRTFLGRGYTWLGLGVLLLIAVVARDARAPCA
ncbi:MAG TPA: hypothetical protein VGL12_14305 [Roseiarcus sp.]